MRRRSWQLVGEEKAVFSRTVAIVTGRMETRATLEWAVSLSANQIGEREAIHAALDHPKNANIKEPWRSAWALIIEGFQSGSVNRMDLDVGGHDLIQNIRNGDKSAFLINEAVELVRPRLKVETRRILEDLYGKSSKPPKHWQDLLSVSMVSGRAHGDLFAALAESGDARLLVNLAHNLRTVVQNGFNLGRRIGWDGRRDWRMGSLYRAYYIPGQDPNGNDRDPDKFHDGIAPSVKFLHAVLERLCEVNAELAKPFVEDLRRSDVPIENRIWTALSRKSTVALDAEIAEFIIVLDRAKFWDIQNENPEFVEVRVVRFNEFSISHQKKILTRVRQGPPRSIWRNSDVSAEEFSRIKDYWVAKELKRLHLAGANLPSQEQTWLDDNVGRFPEIQEMESLDFGFRVGPRVQRVAAQPDQRFASMQGSKRLDALEAALGENRDGPNAEGWMRETINIEVITHDLKRLDVDINQYPTIMSRICRYLRPTEGDNQLGRDVLGLLLNLDGKNLRLVVSEASDWLRKWTRELKDEDRVPGFWLRLWEAALAEYVPHEAREEGETSEHWMIVTTIWDLTTALILLCPNLKDRPRPFDKGALRSMRNALEQAEGETSLIARYVLVGELSYFNSADEQWTRSYLIDPLLNLDEPALWESLSQTNPTKELLDTLGPSIAKKSIDTRLKRDVKEALAARLVTDMLLALMEGANPAIKSSNLTNMLRMVDGEVRAHAANGISRFIEYWTGPADRKPENGARDPAQFFADVVSPFLSGVWPKDAHLVTPGVSEAFAGIPALSGSAFSDAVVAIEHYLIPFDCWSLYDFGMHSKSEDKSFGENLSVIIDTEEAAKALLTLLDKSVGQSDEAIVPHDLSAALEQVKKISKESAKSPIFRRLSTQARKR